MSDETTTDERSNDLETTVVRADHPVINVRNPLSGSGEAHSVHLTDSGSVGKCTCKGWTFHGHCYHTDFIRTNPLLVSSAKAAGSTAKAVATDGGRSTERVRVAEKGNELECECGARTGRPVDMSHHIDLHHPDAENPLPEVTHHTEPAEVGGQRYARCEGCGSESIHGAHRILHETGCALHK